MEWIVGLYFVVGIWKALLRTQADTPHKPMWMYTEKNPVKWCAFFTVYASVWPVIKS